MDITSAANAALGTLYIYFPSKEVVFRELVQDMRQATRALAAAQVSETNNRLDAERASLRAFLTVVRDRPMQYRVVEEARLVDPDLYRNCYTEFGQAYAA